MAQKQLPTGKQEAELHFKVSTKGRPIVTEVLSKKLFQTKKYPTLIGPVSVAWKISRIIILKSLILSHLSPLIELNLPGLQSDLDRKKNTINHRIVCLSFWRILNRFWRNYKNHRIKFSNRRNLYESCD